mgnify:CR=1 FL=1|jgi:hypothetical protein
MVIAANVHDKHLLPDLLHGNERRVGDSAYRVTAVLGSIRLAYVQRGVLIFTVKKGRGVSALSFVKAR